MRVLVESLFKKSLTGKEKAVFAVLVFVLVGMVWKVVVTKSALESVSQSESKGSFSVDDDVASTSKRETNAASTLFFDPVELVINKGKSFTLTAKIDPGMNRISGAELRASFDAKKLKLEKITAAPDFPLSLQAPKIDNVQGTASIALGVPLGQPSLAVMTPVASFSFRALQADGDVVIEFTDRSIVAADYEPGNVVKDRLSARVIIKTP